jgi:spore germination protein
MHAVAAVLFSISAWIPYATEAKGIPDTIAHIQDLTEINPFVYDIRATSTITDEGGVSKGEWSGVFSSARTNGTKIVPTIIWGNKDQIHAMLSSTSSRAAHISSIVSIVSQNNFDGIDIDYEGKYPSDHDLFAEFLGELGATLHSQNKILSCTVEAKEGEYQGIASSCDEVRIMAYDKYYYDFGVSPFSTTTPLSMSLTNAPLSFDRSIVASAEKYIPASKIILGIPTYGYDFTYSIHGVKRNVDWHAAYSYTDAIAKAKTFSAVIHTTAQDEKYFLYTSHGLHHFVVFSDETAFADRLALAKSLGLVGIAIFKIDGKEDPAIWNAIPSVK